MVSANADNITKIALEFDAIDKVEKLFGFKAKDNPITEGLAMSLHMLNSNAKREHLKSINDSYYACKVPYFMDILKELEFKKVLEVDVPEDQFKSKGDKFYIYYNPKIGILTLDTWMEGVNSTKLYFNIKMKGNNYPEHCSGSFCERGIFSGDIDVREGIKYHINQLSESGEFLNPWVDVPFLWFLNHMDTKEKGYDRKLINIERFNLLPKEVRNMIGIDNFFKEHQS